MDTITQNIDLKNLDKSTWKPFRFDQIAKSVSERVDPNTTDLKIYVGLEHLDANNIHIKRKGTPADVEGQKLKCYPGDVIFGKRRAYQRKAAIADFEGICSAHAFVLRANPKVIDPNLFPFFLHSDLFMHRAIDISVGGLSPTINWGNLKEQEFLLPPKEEQAQLAELLWAMDEVIEKKLLVLEKLVKSKYNILENRIVEYCLKNENATLGKIGKWISGGTPSKQFIDYWENGCIPWVTPKDMKGDIILETGDKVSSLAVQSGKARLFPKGSTVLVWRSGILQHTFPIAKILEDFTVNQDLKVFESTSDQFLEEFVRIFLVTNSEKIRRECVKAGTTVQSIDTDSFLKYKFPVLSKINQERIIIEEKVIVKAVESSKEQCKSAKTLQKSLINQIF